MTNRNKASLSASTHRVMESMAPRHEQPAYSTSSTIYRNIPLTKQCNEELLSELAFLHGQIYFSDSTVLDGVFKVLDHMCTPVRMEVINSIHK